MRSKNLTKIFKDQKINKIFFGLIVWKILKKSIKTKTKSLDTQRFDTIIIF
jgi:hypothetical protein